MWSLLHMPFEVLKVDCAMGEQQVHACQRVAALNSPKEGMTTPGVEPGLSRPQRNVLTTRRCGLLAAEVLLTFMAQKEAQPANLGPVGRSSKEIRGKSNLGIKSSATMQRKDEGKWRVMPHLSFLCKSIKQLSMQSSAVQ